MNPILTVAAVAAMTLTASAAVPEPHTPHPAGPFLTNGSPMPPQVFAPEAPAHVAGRSGVRPGAATR